MDARSRERSTTAVGRITLKRTKVGGTGLRPVPGEMAKEKRFGRDQQ
jgi:hypothetical protein